MRSPQPTRLVADVASFYAHALAIEREAATRYRELEAHFRDRGDEVLAGLCANLAYAEARHLKHIASRCRHVRLPAIDETEYAWLDAGPPEAPAREMVYRIANPRQLLEVALAAEYRALDFFRWVALSSPDEAVVPLAREMAEEESQHVAWVENALDYRSATVDWDELIAEGSGPGALTGA